MGLGLESFGLRLGFESLWLESLGLGLGLESRWNERCETKRERPIQRNCRSGKKERDKQKTKKPEQRGPEKQESQRTELSRNYLPCLLPSLVAIE